MKKTKIIIYDPNIGNTQEIKSPLYYLKKMSNNRLTYIWVDTQTQEKQSFNIHKGLLTKLSHQEIQDITINIINGIKKIQKNYNVTTPLTKININYRIL